MSDKFSKQYVVDRVKAREGRLEISIQQDQKILDGMKTRQISELDEIRASNVKTILDFAEEVRRMDKEYEAAETYDEKFKILNSIDRTPSMKYLPYNHTQSERDRALNPKRRYMGDVVKDLRDMRKEQADLAHARLYLEEMPVTEFSLASLKSLGLLSVLRFNLTEAQEKAS